MGTIWVKELTGGLDVRRLPETTPGGVLIRGADGHITRGGEFEKRAAFVAAYALPPGTVNLAHTRTGLVVFGHGPAPSLPTGVTYQRLQHPALTPALVRVLSWDLYDGKIYAVGEFDDGSLHHFYDGARVLDWFDGRARAEFRVLGGDATSELTDLKVNGVSAISAPVSWTTSNEDTATAIAAAITAYSSAPEYTATAVGDTVNLVASAAGPGENGRAVAFTVANGLVLSPATGLTLAGGDTFGGSQATGSFTVTAGGSGSTFLPSVSGVNLTASPVPWATSASVTAASIAEAINAHTSTPDYTASAAGAKVTIVTADRTALVNGVQTTVATTGSASILSGGAFATATFRVGGIGAGGSTVQPRVGGVNITAAPLFWTGSGPTMASSIAAAINAHTSVPNYTAVASSADVTITTATRTDAVNGVTPTFTVVGTININDITAFVGGVDPVTTAVAFAGGADDDAFTPGDFVRTVGSKVYSTAGSLLHFSGIQQPTQWTTDAIGAGFINMASENSGSEQLTAVARYQNLLAVFSPSVVQIWFIDPNPDLNTQSQVLENTGTESPKSVTRFGDSDVFYLDESGLRSLRARDSSNAASTTDIGVPVDDLLVAKLAGLTADDRRRITGLINPIDKRFWLVIKDEIFVFSFFANAKVSAWTTYSLTTYDGVTRTAFEAQDAVVFNRRPYLRSGDTIYVYSGLDGAPVYDHTEAEAWLPYLDASRPTAKKDWEGIDVALTGLWEVRAAMDPTNADAQDIVARVYQTSYNEQRIPFEHSSSHVSLRFRSKGEGRAVLSSATIHFKGDEDED